MAHYIDGFVFPVPEIYLDEYKKVAEQVALIWKEYGALAYYEFLGDDLSLEGVGSFTQSVDLRDGEIIVFGWVVFPSKEIRDEANRKVPLDQRMTELVSPMMQPDKLVFDASRMVYGGFRSLIESPTE